MKNQIGNERDGHERQRAGPASRKHDEADERETEHDLRERQCQPRLEERAMHRGLEQLPVGIAPQELDATAEIRRTLKVHRLCVPRETRDP
jgi:hypothetical protein